MSLDGKKQAILFAVTGLLSLVVAYVLSQQPLILSRSDHFSRWYAAKKLVEEGRSLYDPRNGDEIAALNTFPEDELQGNFFYPAHLLVFLFPGLGLPYAWFYLIWVLLIQIFTILSIWLVCRAVHWPPTTDQFTLLLLLGILFLPNLQNAIWGQFNSIAALSLACAYVALASKKYLLAGVAAAGLTFKPQNTAFTLVLLLIWAIAERKRWPLWIGFGISCACLWLLAEIYEPGWVGTFLRQSAMYSYLISPRSTGGAVYNLSQIIGGIAVLYTLWLFIRNIHASPESPALAVWMAASLAAWWLFVPVVGMMHLVALPVAMVLLVKPAEKVDRRLSRGLLAGLLLLYFFGLVGYIYTVSRSDLYGQHVFFSELAYKVFMPILLTLTTMSIGKIGNMTKSEINNPPSA